MKRVRLADLARTAGVSQGTASNVFNRPDHVRPEVREHVERCARQLDYHGPDPAARMLRAGKVNAIGVVASEPLPYFFTDPYRRLFMTGVAEVCAAWGAGLSLVSAASDATTDWTIQSAIVDGFVVHCMDRNDALIALALRRKLPFVAVDIDAGDDFNRVGIDDEDGAYRAARHVLQLGHRSVAIFTIPLVCDGTVGRASLSRQAAVRCAVAGERMTGYRRALAEAGLDPIAAPVFETRNDACSVRRAFDQLCAGGDLPTAIVAMSDTIALTLLELLSARGMPVPQAVSVIGFDGLPEAETSHPGLTTIVQPIKEKGRRAAEMIFDPGVARREVLDVALVERGSTAPPRR